MSPRCIHFVRFLFYLKIVLACDLERHSARKNDKNRPLSDKSGFFKNYEKTNSQADHLVTESLCALFKQFAVESFFYTYKTLQVSVNDSDFDSYTQYMKG